MDTHTLRNVMHTRAPILSSFKRIVPQRALAILDFLRPNRLHAFINVAAMDADLNTPQAIAALFDLAHEINRARERRQKVGQAQNSLRKLGDILGLTFRERTSQEALSLEPLSELFKDIGATLNASGHHKLAGWVNSHSDAQDAATIVETLLAIRRELRQVREYDLADTIRDRLANLGAGIVDAHDGPAWTDRIPKAANPGPPASSFRRLGNKTVNWRLT